MGLLTEFYVSNLSTLVRSYRESIARSEVINTFEPIYDTMEYLISKNWHPR